MFGLSASHLLILFIILLLFFGAKKLPELGASLGKGIRAFKKSLDTKDEEAPQISEKKPDDDKNGEGSA